ncbi:MAG: carboxypeptidase regulatory-like domain-containing protein [Gammaproteobacteria bacterium]|nr:carboxypeptidase regulatory-like domain-containing protein [Gammaproteobacteria bacterium]
MIRFKGLMMSRYAFAAGLAGMLVPIAVQAATLEGVVRDPGGAAISGALVTATAAGGLFAETVYSDAQGRFRLQTRQHGTLALRARKAYFADATRGAQVAAEGTLTVDFALAPLTDAGAISESLSASAHYTRIRFEDPRDRQFFQVDCLTCHQLGNAYTRAVRPSERWRQILTRMLGFYNVKDPAWIERYAARLEQAFDGTPVDTHQDHTPDPSIFPARVIEWKLPEGMIAHDVELFPGDNRFYTVDQGNDRIYITDPATNLTETFHIPADGIAVGGKFLALYGDPNPFSLAVARGPHSLQLGPDNHYYTTDTVSGQIGEFDPATRTYVGHDIGGTAMYPHTLRFDRKGRVWFTLGVSNQVGYYDTVNDRMQLVEIPTDTDRAQMPALMPYGIDVNPVDGSVWFSSLMANRIGRIDPDTLAVEMFTPPLVGPRRMRFAADGTLWIPGFGSGTLVKLDTRTMTYTSYEIPPLAAGEIEAPYALGVHPRTQEVWITANMSDRMFRFLPAQGRFVAYPLPTRGIYLRDVVFTPNGWVCAASSPVPAALTVEGGQQEIACIDPDGSAPMP